jgi:hypothetical protein
MVITAAGEAPPLELAGRCSSSCRECYRPDAVSHEQHAKVAEFLKQAHRIATRIGVLTSSLRHSARHLNSATVIIHND